MSSSQIQIKLVTKQHEYSVPDTVFSVPGSVAGKELNSLINSLLKESAREECSRVNFDFFVLGELLRLPTLLEHIEAKGASPEEVVEIEYFLKDLPPTPQDSLVHDDWVSSVRATNEWILSGCYDNTLHIWGMDGEHKLTIPGHSAPVKSVAWLKPGNPISSFVSTSHDENAMLWQYNQDTNAVECVHVCKGHARSVDCVAVNSAMNRFVTGSYDQMLKVWSSDDECIYVAGGDDDKKRFKTESGKAKVKVPIITLSGHNDGVSGVQWISDNEICTSSLDSSLKIWDLELGGLKSQLNGSKAFLGISYSPFTKMLISASADRHIRLWDPRSNDGSMVKSVFSSHNFWVTTVRWSPHDEYHFVSGSYDKLVKLWDTRSPNAPLFDISGHDDKVFTVEWHSDTIISGGADNNVKIYKLKDKKYRCTMEQ